MAPIFYNDSNIIKADSDRTATLHETWFLEHEENFTVLSWQTNSLLYYIFAPTLQNTLCLLPMYKKLHDDI